MPEVVLAEGKTETQIIEIARRLTISGQNLLITRLSADSAAAVSAEIPGVTYAAEARVAMMRQTKKVTTGRGNILVVAAGTADLPVAEEAA